MVKTISLLPGITLRCFPDSRFKQNVLSIQFLRSLKEEEASLNAMIPVVLLRGCESARDLNAITCRLDDLYGSSIGVLCRKVGDYQTVGLNCSFISDRFTLEEELLPPMAEFIRDLLFRPVLQDGAFCKDFVDSEKKNLIAAIAAQMNNKRSYAMSRMTDIMCKEDPYGTPRLGRIPQVEAITPESLYRHYQKVLRQSPIELFYVGDQSPEKVAAALKPMFEGMEREILPLPAQTPFQGGTPGRHEETMDVAQGKLVMGFTTPVTLRDKEFAAMQVFNTILGSGMTSKLFMNIREKLSLCYDISSGFYGSKGIVAVSAGIDFDKEELVKEKILEELAACQNGNITDEEMQAAKEALCSSLASVHDAPGAIENYYASGVLSGNQDTPQEYKEQILKVTREAVAAVARSVQLHTVYFLKGVS